MMWVNQKGERISEKEVLEAEFPLRSLTAEEERLRRLHLKTLLAEGTADGPTEAWARRELQVWLTLDAYRAPPSNPNRPPGAD
jgi:hypothetical protein